MPHTSLSHLETATSDPSGFATFLNKSSFLLHLSTIVTTIILRPQIAQKYMNFRRLLRTCWECF